MLSGFLLGIALARVAVHALLKTGYGRGLAGTPAGIVILPFVAALGPWPQRAIILAALVPIGFVVVLVPWLVARAVGAASRAVPAPGRVGEK